MKHRIASAIAASALLFGLSACDTLSLSSGESTAGVPYSLSGANASRNELSPEKGAAVAIAGLYAATQSTVTVAHLGLTAAAGVVAHVIYDPLAPNWRIEESLISPRVYQIALQAKSFRIGGDGEASLIVKRRAVQLQRATGASGYRLREYTEGIDSSTPFTQRYATGVVELLLSENSGSNSQPTFPPSAHAVSATLK